MAFLLGCELLQVRHDISLDSADRSKVGPAHDRDPIGSHQELLEVPADVVHFHWLPGDVLVCAHNLRGVRTGVLQRRSGEKKAHGFCSQMVQAVVTPWQAPPRESQTS